MKLGITVTIAICCLWLTGCVLSTGKVSKNYGIVNNYTSERIQPAFSAQASQQGDVSGGGAGVSGGEIGSGVGGSEVITDASGTRTVRYNAK
jgi:hypothetical protein